MRLMRLNYQIKIPLLLAAIFKVIFVYYLIIATFALIRLTKYGDSIKYELFDNNRSLFLYAMPFIFFGLHFLFIWIACLKRWNEKVFLKENVIEIEYKGKVSYFRY